jgi:putative ABC transport system permease protein
MRELLQRLLDRLRRERLDDELAEELRFHRAQAERDARAGGASDADARHAAARALGNVTAAREAARERWSLPPVEHFLRDLRHATRALARSPGFTATVILTLGLGIGANVAMFTVVDRLMYRPLAYLREPESVHRLYLDYTFRGQQYPGSSTEYTRYLDLQRWTTSFERFAAFSERSLAVGEGESALERQVGVVSASYFGFFDAVPVLGRFFTAEEDVVPRGADVAVLSHGFWQSEFGGGDVLGRQLQVGEVRATIIGVAPPGFHGVDDANPPALWIPMTTFAASGGTEDSRRYYLSYEWGWVRVLVQRKPGVTREAAEADATQAYARSWEAHRAMEPALGPAEDARPRIHVAGVRLGAGPNPSLETRTARWVSYVAAFVLLIACANVANLFLARALRRRREVAVRLALGVSRARLLAQSVTESLVLALLGGVAAVAVAQWGGTLIRRVLIARTAPSMQLFTDWRTLGVTLAIAVTAGTLVGLVPALLASRGGRDLAGTLRGGARGGARDGRRVRAGLLVTQAALSVALLVGAALFVRSLDAVQQKRMGYDADRVLLVQRVSRGLPMTDSAQVPLRRLLLETAERHPDVEAAAWISSAPMVSTSSTSLFVAGIDSVGRLGSFTYQAASPDYFRAMGTRILRGRAFAETDGLGAPRAVVVSESMAQVLWPGRDALGQCLRLREPTDPCWTVVGVAEDMVQRDILAERQYSYYLPIDQFTRTWGRGLALRIRGDPVQKAEGIRVALQRVMPGASYVTTQPLGQVVESSQRSWRLGATMFAVFGLLALVVAAVGLYGVISYDVAERTHELGVRVALGASRANLLRLVAGEGVRFTAIGVAIGLGIAAAGARWVQPLLFEQEARDPVVYGAVGAIMLAVALLASALPASRASRSDPAVALRAE